MSCRNSSFGSAVTSWIRLGTSLTDDQNLSVFHHLTHQFADAPAPTPEQQTQLLQSFRSRILGDPSITAARRRSLLERLDRAEQVPLTGALYQGAIQHLDRARAADYALNAYCESAARDLGVTPADARALVNDRHQAALDGGRDDAASGEWLARFRSAPEHANLPLSRATARAMEQVEQRRAAARAATSTPTVNRQPVNSSAIASMGWDARTGRMEVEMRSRPGVAYAYRMTHEQWNEFQSAPSLGAHFARHIRGNPDVRWDSTDHADESAETFNCPSCGQFASAAVPCPCPPRGSVEEHNRMVRQAEEAARDIGETGNRVESPEPAPTVPTVAPEPVAVSAAAESVESDTPAPIPAAASVETPAAEPVTDSVTTAAGDVTVAAGAATVRARIGDAGLAPAEGTVQVAARDGARRNYYSDIRVEGAEAPQCAFCDNPAIRSRQMSSYSEGSRTVNVCGTNHRLPTADSYMDQVRWQFPYRDRVVADGNPTGTGVAGRMAVRTLPISDLRTAAREGAGIQFPVEANWAAVDAYGVSRSYRVHGQMRAMPADASIGGGFAVSAVTHPGDSQVDRLRCTCPEYRSRYDCEHVRAVLADVANRMNSRVTRDPQQVADARRVTAESVATDFSHAEALTAAARARWEAGDDGVNLSVSDDYDTWQNWYKDAKETWDGGQGVTPIEYRTENALAGLGSSGPDDPSGRTFGLEIEIMASPAARRRIGQRLFDEGLTTSPSQLYYGEGRHRTSDVQERGWRFETDVTVDAEIVTPIMHDTPEAWANLKKVLDIVNEEGGTVNQQCGMHINVGVKDFNHTLEKYNTLGRAITANADILHRLATDPARGTHRNTRWTRFHEFPLEGYNSMSALQRNGRTAGHNVAYNFAHTGGSGSTRRIEYRVFDGSLNPGVIQAQVLAAVAVTTMASRDAGADMGQSMPPGTHRDANREANDGRVRNLPAAEWRESTAATRRFLDAAFNTAEAKRRITQLFAMNKWQRGSQ